MFVQRDQCQSSPDTETRQPQHLVDCRGTNRLGQAGAAASLPQEPDLDQPGAHSPCLHQLVRRTDSLAEALLLSQDSQAEWQ